MITPQESYPALAAAIGVPELYLKREDLHPYGSHKGRSIPLMIDTFIDEGITHFVVSSSGNAALAAIHTVRDHKTDLILEVYVGENIPRHKLDKLKELANESITIHQVEKPKQSAFKAGKKNDVINLRQSTGASALVGYHALADELAEIDTLAAVFIPTSSGTTAQGLAKGFKTKGINPQIHIAQTTSCHPIAGEYMETEFQTTSIASAIVDKVAHRKTEILEVINNSNGSGWIITNEEIKATVAHVREHIGLEISPNSALSIAAAKKAVKNGFIFDGTVVCLVCGE